MMVVVTVVVVCDGSCDCGGGGDGSCDCGGGGDGSCDCGGGV